MKINIIWYRNDLRIENHLGLYESLQSPHKTQALFVFDENILEELPSDDARVSFIYETLSKLNQNLNQYGSAIDVRKGKPFAVWKKLIEEYEIAKVYMAEDYEPYSIQRDQQIIGLLKERGIEVHTAQNQLIMPPKTVLKEEGTPYSIFTPFSKKWKSQLSIQKKPSYIIDGALLKGGLHQKRIGFPTLESLGFSISPIQVSPYTISKPFLEAYDQTRNNPNINTSFLGPYLRFGIVDVFSIFEFAKENETFLNELIWREFFKHILYFYPNVVYEEFQPKYRGLPWKNNAIDFERWKNGMTGFPLVDAGMRQLKETGFMHNRVRMLTASFLVKDLLIDWRWGEAYFAEKLLDYDLSANNGNWQWAAGTGCDAAPYFRIFNPETQLKKIDPNGEYIRKWIPEWNTLDYPTPMVNHKAARERALRFYKNHLSFKKE